MPREWTPKDAQRAAAQRRTGKITPHTAPLPGEYVVDADRGPGTVVRTLKGAACWIKFDSSEDLVYYSLRAELGRWLAFPGPADAQGLRITELVG